MIFAVLLSVIGIPVGAADGFSVKAELNYRANPVTLEIEGTTPSKYGQIISIVVYELDTADLEAVKEADGTFSDDPAAKKVLENVSDIIRIDEICADYSGRYALSISLSNVEDAKYFIVAASGGGSESDGAAASQIIYYEKQETIDHVTLPAFNAATAQTLGTLLEQKQLLLGFSCDADYKANSAIVHDLFISVRAEDYQNTFDTITDVQNALKAVTILRTLRSRPSAAQVETTLTDNAPLLGDYDFTDTDYTDNASSVHSMLSQFLGQEALLPNSMSDVADLIEQAAALVILNQLDATRMSGVIEKYAQCLGVSLQAYDAACEAYGSNAVNMAFVERNFTTPAAVNEAFLDRMAVLQKQNENENREPESNRNTGGGGNRVVKIDNNYVQPDGSASQVPALKAYSDLSSSHWAYESVQVLSAKGIIEGFPDGSFAPDLAVTREQMVKMLVGAFSLTGDTSIEFTDVSPDRWSVPYIAAAAKNGITGGLDDGSFAPDREITRQDAAVMLGRICSLLSIELSGKEQEAKDSELIADYAKDSVAALMGAGILSGFPDGSFHPSETLTRAQAAKMINGLLQ